MRLLLKDSGVIIHVVLESSSRTPQLPEEVEVQWSRLPTRVKHQLQVRAPSVVFGPADTLAFQELKDALTLARTASDVIVIDDSDSEDEGEEEEGMVLVGMLGTTGILPFKLVVTVGGGDQVVGYLVRGGGGVSAATRVSDMLSPAKRNKRKREDSRSPPPPSTATKKIKTLAGVALTHQQNTTPVVNRQAAPAGEPSSSSSASASPSPPAIGAYEEETEDDDDDDEQDSDTTALNRRTTFLLFQLYIHSRLGTRWDTEPHVTQVRQALSHLPGVQVPTKDQLTDLLYTWGGQTPPIERRKMRGINGLQAGLLMGLVHKKDAWPTTKEEWKDLGSQLQACGVVGGGMEEFSSTYLKKKRRTCTWLGDASVRQAVAFYSSVMGP